MKRNLLLSILLLFISATAFGALSTPGLFSPFDNNKFVGVAVHLKANAVNNATSYEFKVSTSSFFTTYDLYTSDTSNVEIDGLEFGEEYFWKVRAKSATDSSSWSAWRRFTVVTQMRLSYPNNNSTNTIGGKAGLRIHNYGMEEFIIEFDTSSTMNSGYLQTFYFTDTTKYYTITRIVDSLYFGKDYYWRAVGWKGNDTLQWSDTYKFTTMTEPSLKSPVNTQIIETDYTFEFYLDYNMDYYEYEMDTSPSFNSPVLLKDTMHPPNGEFTVTEMNFGTKFYWRVRGFSTIDTTDWAMRECTTDGTKSKYFNDQSPAYNPTIAFKIGRAKYASEMQIEFDTSFNFNSPLQKSLTITYDPTYPSYFRDTVKNLHYGMEYRMRIRMMASHDTSDWKVLARKLNIRDYPSNYYPFNNWTDIPVDTLLWWDAGYLIGDNFRLQLDTNPSFISPILDTIKPSKQASGLSNENVGVKLRFDTDYYWRMMTWHEDDTSLWLPAKKFTTVGKPTLTRPFNTTILRQGTTTKFEWDEVKGVKTFQLQLDTSTDYNSSELIDTIFTTSSATELELAELIFGRHYKWRLRSITDKDTSKWSDDWEFIVWEKPRLNSPKNNAINTGIFGSFDFNSIDGTTGYQIQIDTTSDLSNTPIIINVVNNPFFHYHSEDLRFDEQYHWRVKVFHESDTSEWSDQWTFTTRSRNAPNLVSPAHESTDRPLGLDLDWDQFSNANNYLVQLSLNSDMSDSTEYKEFTSKQTVSLRPDTIYYWRVMARNVDDFAISDFTEVWQFRTADSFEKVVLTVPANNTVGQPSSFTFRWEGVVGASGYDFQLSINPDMSGADNRSSTNNQLAYNGLSNNTTYYWHVRAKNAYTKGPWSDVFTFNTNTDGINTIENSPIKIYPNPTTGVFNIQLNGQVTNGKIAIYNTLNQLVYSADATDNLQEVDLTNQPTGMYYVVYSVGNKVYTIKIAKQ